MAACSLLLPKKNSLPCLLVVVLLAVSLGAASCSPTVAVVSQLVGSGNNDDSSSSSDGATEMMERFQRWKAEYNRSYATASEDQYRFQVYANNMRYIKARNTEDPSYGLGETEYTDLSTQEFMDMYAMVTPLDDDMDDDDDEGGDFNDGEGVGVGDSDGDGGDFDFDDGDGEGVGVGGRRCRRCVRRCVRRCFPVGVGGGGGSGGVGVGGRRCIRRCRRHCVKVRCPWRAHHAAATVAGFQRVTANDEASLMNAVARQPVAAAIMAGHPDLHHFRGQGVYHGRCGSRFNHVVAVVGYGEDQDTGEKYWIVKNSWGANWGDAGYIKMKRQVPASSPEGHCGLAIRTSFPTM